MKATGKLNSVSRSMEGNLLVTFLLNERNLVPEIEAIKEIEIDIEAKKHRKKRSLDANAYFHVLVNKMAKVNKITDTAQKNMLIGEYGCWEVSNGEIASIFIKDSIDYLEYKYLHLYPTQEVTWDSNGEMYRRYLIRAGSHTYDTKQMADLIDGTVREAKGLGIETMTPDELERMKAAWKERKS